MKQENDEKINSDKELEFAIFCIENVAVELYFDRLIDKIEAITRLRYEKPNMQVCFRTQSVLEQYLSFEGSEKV